MMQVTLMTTEDRAIKVEIPSFPWPYSFDYPPLVNLQMDKHTYTVYATFGITDSWDDESRRIYKQIPTVKI
jgi:hypothetical protein